MKIRTGTESDLIDLIPLLKQFYPVHNRFARSKEEIILYLKQQLAKNTLYILEGNKAMLFLVKFSQSNEGNHGLVKFRHFACTDDEAGKELIDYVEKIIKQEYATAKIELTIAETEPSIHLYKRMGYNLEGTLKSHYRLDEDCYIYSKLIFNLNSTI